jgi:hypothetical protein
MVSKAHILREIKRTAEENGGIPLGMQRFESETGIKPSDWKGRYWIRWSDAIREAGYIPNQLSRPDDITTVLDKYAGFANELGHFPIDAELLLKRRSDCTFPSRNAFRRFRTKFELIEQLAHHCQNRTGYCDVIRLCEDYLYKNQQVPSNESENRKEEIGFVYLNKSGRLYYIGKSNSAGRRKYEHDMRLPGKVEQIHKIPTPNPLAAERYWQERFSAKHDHGSWYNLDKKDVAAFKKCKFM